MIAVNMINIKLTGMRRNKAALLTNRAFMATILGLTMFILCRHSMPSSVASIT